MGKREKEHRRKVRNRNQRLSEQQAKIKKELNAAMQEQIEAIRQKYEAMSGETNSDLTENVNNEENTEKRSEPTQSV
jgi:hypothetical protein